MPSTDNGIGSIENAARLPNDIARADRGGRAWKPLDSVASSSSRPASLDERPPSLLLLLLASPADPASFSHERALPLSILNQLANLTVEAGQSPHFSPLQSRSKVRSLAAVVDCHRWSIVEILQE